MSGELQVATTQTGRPIYAILRNANGSVWSVVAGAAEGYSGANLANYAASLTEQGGSRYYVADMPAASADVYFAVFYDQQGSGPAETDPIVGQQTIYWLGSQLARPHLIETRLPANLIGGRIDASIGDVPTTPAGLLGDAILDHVSGIEPGFTLRQGLRIMLAALAGKLSGAGTTAITIRATNDSKSRIIAAVDASGNRSALFLDPS